MLIAQKFGVHRDAVFARVRSQCRVDLADAKSEGELTRAMDVLEEIRSKGMAPEPTSVFVVLHVHVLPGDVEDIKMIGVYRTEAAAHAVIDRLGSSPAFGIILGSWSRSLMTIRMGSRCVSIDSTRTTGSRDS